VDWLAKFRPPPRLTAVFHDDYVLGIDPVGPHAIHDPQRPAKVRRALQARALRRKVAWVEPAPISVDDLERVHTPAYLEVAMQPSFIGQVLGIHGILPWETEVWTSLRLVVGGTLAAARAALANGNPAFNLSGGYHHAWPKRAAGFCIINDVAVAVAVLRAGGFTAPIAIVDLDYHHGDGTEACLIDDHATWTFSLHANDWEAPGKHEALHVHITAEADDAPYLAAVDAGLAALGAKLTPALVMYVAGADPSMHDAMCRMRLSDGGMLARDLRVARWARRFGAPLAVVPAGGYGTRAWQPYAAFAEALIRGADR
jgi:acetoin utilization deacetylase AcuC-like enzyme